MGSLRLTLCTGLLAVTALTPTAAAYAADADARSVSVTPSSPAPGTDVALRVRGCAGKTATAASAAFVADARLTSADGGLAGETRVRSSIEPGSYDVKIVCADVEVKGHITVVGKATSQPSAHASPVAPVHAGGGGTATHLSAVNAVNAAEARGAAGPGTVHAVIGLVLASVAAVAVVLRSSRRSRGTD
ncbi:hypothetical protein [Streptomyces fulvoviolaceus]|uniref:hypothetical protein n=1 Tax=Streptomyces fulvoviolaceus TaxID=285535 RepID=UPI0021C12D2B|nr:hypothetical protein [Streptomyces fulvoviolaceus]MCT9079399.1 hypothetical protein [Streptomyces fulvoviolaceus]